MDATWTGFAGPRSLWLAADAGRLGRLKDRMEQVFRSIDGSGSAMTLDTFERPATSARRHGEERVFQLVAYLEGLPQTSTEFHDGELTRRGMRPALELALTYAPETGGIDVVAHAGKQARTAVAHAFVEELLPADLALAPVRLRQFDLGRLLRPVDFPTAAEDGIRSVRLVLARLVPGGRAGRVTLELDRRSPRSLHEIARDWFGAHDPFALASGVARARLVIEFEPRPGQRRARVLPVEPTEPHGCNLRDRSDEERLVGEKYLRLWGLEREVRA